MKQSKGRSNGHSLFQVEQIPSDAQIRNVLDPLTPDQFDREYRWVMDELEKSGHLQGFRSHQNTLLVALDGVTYHSSTTIHCDECLHRQDSQGTRHYYHSAITPVIVKPNSPHVLPLPPALIVPQDGHEKQDCAPGRHPTAVKRWLAHQAEHDRAWTKTYLGDDLYANQPLCQLLAETDHQFLSLSANPIRTPRAIKKLPYAKPWAALLR